MQRLALAILPFLFACASVQQYNPFSEADTPSKKAYAIGGTYEAYQKIAYRVVRDPEVPLKIRQGIQDADGVTAPLVEAMLVALETYEVTAEKGVESDVARAFAALELAVTEAEAPVTAFVEQIQEWL